MRITTTKPWRRVGRVIVAATLALAGLSIGTAVATAGTSSPSPSVDTRYDSVWDGARVTSAH